MNATGWLIAAAFATVAALAGIVGATVLRWGTEQHSARLSHLSGVRFAELFLFLDPAQFIKLNLIALLCLPLLSWPIVGAFGAGLIFALILVMPGAVYRWLHTRRRRALQSQLPDVATALASGLRSGLSLGQAMDQVVRFQPAPMAQEFALMLREHRIGLPLEQALQGLAERSGLHDFHLLVATLGIARDLGGGLAEALERFASTLRRRLALEARIRALTAQGRLQGVIMGALPLLLGWVLYLMEPSVMGRMFSEPLGWAVLCVIAVLEGAGFVLIRRIVDIRV
jgi:tight adherence protein B